MSVLKGLLGLAKRGSDLLTNDEIAQLNKYMEGVPEFEAIQGQNDIMPVTVDLAEEMVKEARDAELKRQMRGELGGSGPEMESLFHQPAPPEDVNFSLRQRIRDLEKDNYYKNLWFGAAGYGGYKLGQRDKDKK